MVHWNITFELDLDGGSIEYFIESIQDVMNKMSEVGFGEVVKVVDVDAEKDFSLSDVLKSTTTM